MLFREYFSVLKLLIIGYVWPEPTSSGAGVRMMELIRLALAQGWRLTFASPAATSEYMVDLHQIGVETAEVALNDSSFDRFVATLDPDLVLFDRFMMEEQFGWRVERACPRALRIIETIDLHFLRDARHRAVKREQRVVRHVEVEALLESEMALREIAAIYRADLSLLISEAELHLLSETFGVPAALLHLCPFMFDETMIEPDSLPCEARRHFMSIGNFRHAPNWDAVLWLKQTVWPLIRKELPDAQLHLYGAYAPKKAMALHAPEEGFYLQGRTPDAMAVMKQARICLAPLRFGAGIKGKLADAMLAGTPSITTSVGAESMRGGLPWGGVIADDAHDFAAAAVELYRDNEAWRQAQQHGYAIVRSLFDARRNGEALVGRIATLLNDLERHRRNNFTGAMLRHHHQRSTEYMSRWIEAKNHLNP